MAATSTNGVEIMVGDVVEYENGYIGIVTEIADCDGYFDVYVCGVNGGNRTLTDFAITDVYANEAVAAPAASMLKDFDDAQPEAPAPSGAASPLKDFDASEPMPAKKMPPSDIWTPDCEGTSSPEHLEAVLERNALRAENEALKQQLATARAALEWYAEKTHYVKSTNSFAHTHTPVIDDGGKRALEALNK